jgi:hypothetical protein
MSELLNSDEEKYLSDIVSKETKKIKDIIAPRIEKLYSDAHQEIALHEYTLKLFKDKYERILELYKPNILHKDKSLKDHIGFMFYQTHKSLQTILELVERNEGASIDSDLLITLSEYDKEHAGILKDWVTFNFTKADLVIQGDDPFVYAIELNSEGRKILDDLNHYTNSNNKR